jgi:hypothetical protein
MRIAAFLALLALPHFAHAGEFNSLGALTQRQFRLLGEDLGAAFSYKGVTPGTPLGTLGIDIGIAVTDTTMEHSDLFAIAGAGGQSHILVPKLHVAKGLPGGFDIAAFAAGSGDVGAGLFGGEVRYTAFDGIALPAFAVRLSGTMATGMGDLRMSTASVDAMLSKSFVVVTPYIGGGITRVQAKVNGSTLATEKFDQGRVFGGVNVNLVGANFVLEVEKSGDNTSISAKVGMRF